MLIEPVKLLTLKFLKEPPLTDIALKSFVAPDNDEHHGLGREERTFE
jgi:hypothetical protein